MLVFWEMTGEANRGLRCALQITDRILEHVSTRGSVMRREQHTLTLDVGTSLASLHTLQVGIQTRNLAIPQGVERVHRDASVVVVARVTGRPAE